MLFSGLALQPSWEGEQGKDASRFFPPFAMTETFRFVLGVAAIVTGILKLLSPVRDDVPFIGDLFPAAAGILAGFDLIYENIRMKKISEVVEKIDKKASIRRFLDGKTYIGIAAMAAAALHFLFPSIVII